jgi:photosystem II P680 reaction center D1 protein
LWHHSILDGQGHVIPSWAEVINRAILGMDVMYERNVHNFAFDRAAADVASMVLTAPLIG